MLKAPILAFGGAHVERVGRMTAAAGGEARTSGRWSETVGGCTFNAACVLARFGHATTLITPRGGDAGATALAQAADAAGVNDCPVTFLDRTTPSRSTVRDAMGDTVLTMDDMELYRLLTPRRLRVRAMRDALAMAGGVLCDTDLPPDTLGALAAAARQRDLPVTAMVSTSDKAHRLKEILGSLSLLFLTDTDAAALAAQQPERPEDWPAILRTLGLVRAVILSADRLMAFDREQVFRMGIARMGSAGERDVIVAATLAGLADGLAFPQALRFGLAAARLDLQAPGSRAAELGPHRLRSLVTDVILPDIAEADILS